MLFRSDKNTKHFSESESLEEFIRRIACVLCGTFFAHLPNFEYICALKKKVKSMVGQKTPTALGTENIGKSLL